MRHHPELAMIVCGIALMAGTVTHIQLIEAYARTHRSFQVDISTVLIYLADGGLAIVGYVMLAYGMWRLRDR
jgi:hypothetical protein